jgi:hypothetical protein
MSVCTPVDTSIQELKKSVMIKINEHMQPYTPQHKIVYLGIMS